MPLGMRRGCLVVDTILLCLVVVVFDPVLDITGERVPLPPSVVLGKAEGRIIVDRGHMHHEPLLIAVDAHRVKDGDPQIVDGLGVARDRVTLDLDEVDHAADDEKALDSFEHCIAPNKETPGAWKDSQ